MFDIESFKDYLSICFNTKFGTLVDDNNLLENVSNIGKHGNGEYRIKIKGNTNIKEIMDFINQIINL